MKNISVVSATYNRAELLDNALYTYSRQALLGGLTWEYILVDDMSTDNTKEVAIKWASKIPLVYVTSEELGLPKKPGEWRDGCTLRNRASTLSNAEFLILTHPEILVPPDALFGMYAKGMGLGEERLWVTAIPYWLPKGILKKGWKTDIWKLKEMKGFYDPSWPGDTTPGAIDYRNQHQEVRETWESEVFAGFKMRDWRWFGGFQEFKQWGSVDIDQMNRRRAAGFKTVFAKSLSSPHQKGYLMVYHQHHESKRDGDLALKGVEGMVYPDAEAARKVGGLYNIYYHGERERAHDGKLGGVLGDHIARYEFAGQYVAGKVVLDIPAGTGYGAKLLSPSSRYVGVDIDAESILWGREHYGSETKEFRQGDMTFLPVESKSIDILVCFEGIEHIVAKAAFVDEMYRVLKPGGTFIISTPNPANAPGTFWDKYMITPEELLNVKLFGDGRWAGLDKFHQMSYSIDKVPVKPGWNTRAQITILGGTKV